MLALAPLGSSPLASLVLVVTPSGFAGFAVVVCAGAGFASATTTSGVFDG